MCISDERFVCWLIYIACVHVYGVQAHRASIQQSTRCIIVMDGGVVSHPMDNVVHLLVCRHGVFVFTIVFGNRLNAFQTYTALNAHWHIQLQHAQMT